MKNHTDNKDSGAVLHAKTPAPRPDAKKEKLARALKANLLRRKQSASARSGTAE